VRKWTDFPVQQDPERLLISGVLYDEMWTPQEDTGYYVMNPSLGQAAGLFPQGQGRVRAYLIHTKATSVQPPRSRSSAPLCRGVREDLRARPVVCRSQGRRPPGHI
jgi:hypothetical protein